MLPVLLTLLGLYIIITGKIPFPLAPQSKCYYDSASARYIGIILLCTAPLNQLVNIIIETDDIQSVQMWTLLRLSVYGIVIFGVVAICLFSNKKHR